MKQSGKMSEYENLTRLKKRNFKVIPLFEVLPNEMLICIMFYIHVTELTNIRLISKRWNEIIDNSEYFWKKQCEVWRMDFSIYEKEFGGIYKEKKNYKKKFIKRFLSYQCNLGKHSVFPSDLNLASLPLSKLEEIYNRNTNDKELKELYPVRIVKKGISFKFKILSSFQRDGNTYFCFGKRKEESSDWIIFIVDSVDFVEGCSNPMIYYDLGGVKEKFELQKIRMLKENNLLLKFSRDEDNFYEIHLIKIETKLEKFRDDCLDSDDRCVVINYVTATYYNSIFDCLFCYCKRKSEGKEEIEFIIMVDLVNFEEKLIRNVKRFREEVASDERLSKDQKESIINGKTFRIEKIFFEDDYVFIFYDYFLTIHKLFRDENEKLIEVELGTKKYQDSPCINPTFVIIHNGVIYSDMGIENKDISSIDIHTMKVKKVFQRFDKEESSFLSFMTFFPAKNKLLTIECIQGFEQIQFQIIGKEIQEWHKSPILFDVGIGEKEKDEIKKTSNERFLFNTSVKYYMMFNSKQLVDAKLNEKFDFNKLASQGHFLHRGKVVKKHTRGFIKNGEKETKLFDIYRIFDPENLTMYVYRVKHPSFLVGKEILVIEGKEKCENPLDIGSGFLFGEWDIV